MRNTPFRVVFIGIGLFQSRDRCGELSPQIQGLSLNTWDELPCVLADFTPELVVVDPQSPGRPGFDVPVPVLVLPNPEIGQSVDAIEAFILQNHGRMVQPSPEAKLLGRSPAISRVRGQLVTTAKSRHPLLLTGENGTGKDLAATIVHELSPRTDQPMVAVNCGAIPPGLAETEFFGAVRGAFTGAENRNGYCQQAHGGTLFLDEIGELSPEIQAKLLRVLENRQLRRVGSSQVEAVDFRLICATNRNLSREVRDGRFREDLYYRINVLTVEMPALRDRLEDIPALAAYFLSSETTDRGKAVSVGPRGLGKLASYHWPGNLRQLRNVLLRACVLHNRTELEPEHIELDP